MKRLLFLFVMTFSFASFSGVIKHDDKALDSDLEYSLDDESSDQRKIASDEENKIDDAKDSDESDREVASDKEQSDSGIKYWKY